MFRCIYNSCLLTFEVLVLIIRIIFAMVSSAYYMIGNPTRKNLNGEIVLVTGASRGIGRALALEFAKRGSILVLWGTNEEKLKQTAEDVKKLNGTATYYVCDVADQNAVKRTASQVSKEVGDVTILVNNAGVSVQKPIWDQTSDSIQRTLDVNLMSNFWIIAEFLPKMVEHMHGHLVAISSFGAFVTTPNVVPYIASKFGLRGMMEALREEFRYYKQTSIQFTTVFPSFVNTDMLKSPRIKYQWLSPMLTPEFVAQKTVEGIQENADNIFIPGHFSVLSKILPLLPLKVRHLIADFADSGVDPEEK